MALLDFSLNLIVFVLTVLILTLICFKVGKKPIVSLILATYPSVLIFANLPFIEKTPSEQNAYFFAAIFAITTFLIWRNIHVKKSHSFLRKLIDYILLSFSFVVMMASVSVNSITSLKYIYEFNNFVTDFFLGIPHGYLLIAPIVLILITNKGDQ